MTCMSCIRWKEPGTRFFRFPGNKGRPTGEQAGPGLCWEIQTWSAPSKQAELTPGQQLTPPSLFGRTPWQSCKCQSQGRRLTDQKKPGNLSESQAQPSAAVSDGKLKPKTMPTPQADYESAFPPPKYPSLSTHQSKPQSCPPLRQTMKQPPHTHPSAHPCHLPGKEVGGRGSLSPG